MATRLRVVDSMETTTQVCETDGNNKWPTGDVPVNQLSAMASGEMLVIFKAVTWSHSKQWAPR